MKKLATRLLISNLLVFCLCAAFALETDAANVYRLTVEDEILTGTYNDNVMQNVYVSVKQSGDTYKVVKPCTKKSTVYYFNEEGVGTPYKDSKFIKISYNGKKKTYYSKKGILQTNKIVGSKNQGYYYVDSTGVRITDKTTKLAVKFVRSHTKSTDSQSTKLKKCYNYLSSKRNYTYKRYYTGLYPKAKKMQSLAYDMLSTKEGNCHRYAASFAYIAKVLGYDCKVVVGKITSSRGGMTPHGWNEVKKDGKWYVCDPDMQMNGYNSYMKTYTPFRTTVTRKCTITAKNGKIIWK